MNTLMRALGFIKQCGVGAPFFLKKHFPTSCHLAIGVQCRDCHELILALKVTTTHGHLGIGEQVACRPRVRLN